MATVRAEPDGLRVELTGRESWSAFRRTDLTAPWAHVEGVEAVAEPYRLVHGLRAPGLSIPGRTKIGTWRSAGRKTFAVTHRGRAGVRIRLRNNTYQQLLIDVDTPTETVELLRNRIGAPAHVGNGTERTIDFPSGPVTLAGTATIPGAPRAAAVLISGSGDIDRDGNGRRAPLGISRDIADALAAADIASLRYDKRGVGASGGDFLSSGFADNIDDARAAISALRSQAETAGIPMVVIGHSEGAMIATVLAGESANQLAGAVLLSAPAGTGEEVMLWQADRIAPTLPKPVRFIMRMFRTDPLRQQGKLLERLKLTSTDVVRIQGARINAKWFRELLDFDAEQHLALISAPVLAITGTKDLQVDPDDLEVISSTVLGPVTVDLVPDLTHILRRDNAPPTLGAYRRLCRQPVDHVVLQEISDWILTVSGKADDRRDSAES